MAVLSMSKQEFSRLDVLLRVQSGRLRVIDACVLIGLQRRQVFRLLRGLEQEGATSLLSQRRGRPSNHRLPDEVRTLALSIVRERYSDFGPSLAAEKLAEHHGCSVLRIVKASASSLCAASLALSGASGKNMMALLIDGSMLIVRFGAVIAVSLVWVADRRRPRRSSRTDSKGERLRNRYSPHRGNEGSSLG